VAIEATLLAKMSEETPAEGMTAKKVHFANPSARQAVAVSPEANKMTGGTSAATTPGLESQGATGTMAVAGTAMDVNNDKKRPASSPKRPSSKHRPKTDETQQDVEMKEAEAPRTMSLLPPPTTVAGFPSMLSFTQKVWFLAEVDRTKPKGLSY
jgi:hypothetical protein